jgi:hypothetical protein
MSFSKGDLLISKKDNLIAMVIENSQSSQIANWTKCYLLNKEVSKYKKHRTNIFYIKTDELQNFYQKAE